MPQEITTATVLYRSGDETVSAFLARPQEPGTYPAVIVIQEWWGLDNHIKDVTTRFAREGYVGLAPDLYRGVVTNDPQQAMQLSRNLPRDRAVQDLQQAIAYLRGQGVVRGDRIGCIGFCLGGGISLLLACQSPDLSAAIVFYGGNPSPLEQVQNITCPLLGIYGGADTRITFEQVPPLMQALEQYQKDYRVKIYSGAPHAFFNDQSPQVYRAEAARDAWQETLAFYQQHLQN